MRLLFPGDMGSRLTYILQEGIRSLAAGDAAALLRLAGEARTSGGIADERETAEIERLRHAFRLLLVLTGRNLRLLRIGYRRPDGYAVEDC